MIAIDRYRGALLGLAAGDALGTTLEFRAPGTFEPVVEMTGGGPFGLRPGEWTDDTSMALCLAESLIERGGFDPSDQLNRYVRWRDEGHLASNGRCFDIGIRTNRSLEAYLASGEAYRERHPDSDAGNGSLMRLAPVPLFFALDPDAALERAADSSRTTHSARPCVDACRYFGGLIVSAVNGVEKRDLLAPLHAPVPGYWRTSQLHPEIDEVAAGSFARREPPEIRGSGHVVRCLEAALWAFARSDTFEKGCLLAVNLGDDADTTGAVFGQIAGAYYGAEGIPVRWREILARRELIISFADRLYERARELDGSGGPS